MWDDVYRAGYGRYEANMRQAAIEIRHAVGLMYGTRSMVSSEAGTEISEAIDSFWVAYMSVRKVLVRHAKRANRAALMVDMMSKREQGQYRSSEPEPPRKKVVRLNDFRLDAAGVLSKIYTSDEVDEFGRPRRAG